MSDNGPQYACVEFREFAQQYQFQHITSSPKHAQANGAAERAVQTVKSLLKKNSDSYLALLAYRTSPLENGLSPAELFMSRRLRTTLPTLPGLLEPQVNSRQAVENKEQKINERSKASYDHRHRARPLTPLQTGDKVFVTDMKTQATISRPLSETPRSYILRTPNDNLVRRNRCDIRPLSSPAPVVTQPSHPSTPQSVQGYRPTPTSVNQHMIPPKKSSYGREIRPPRKLDL